MRRLTLLGLLLPLALMACGGGGDAPAESATAPASAPSEAAKTVDPASVGMLTGKVSYTGEEPRLARLRMNADPSCAEQHSEATYAQDLLVEEGAVKNAFVWVTVGLDDYQFDPPNGQVELDQVGCVYTPHVLGLRSGQELKVLNSDPTTHNINPSPQNNRNWNISQGPGTAPQIKTFARQEVMIPVKCNVHPWMRSYIGVVNHPYFDVTGADGTFELKDLPPGDYTVQVWHERLGTQEMQVSVAASESKTLDFSYSG